MENVGPVSKNFEIFRSFVDDNWPKKIRQNNITTTRSTKAREQSFRTWGERHALAIRKNEL